MKFNEILKTADCMLELLFYNTHEAIACVDTQGCLVEVNQAFLELFGYTREEVVEKNLEELIHRGPLDTKDHNFFHNVLAGKQDELEGICYGKQGFPTEILIKGFPVLSGGITSASFFIFSSHGEDEQLQNVLRQREERYRFLAENMGDIIWVLDLDFNTIYVSPSVKKVLGYTPEERKKQNYREIITPESQALILTTLQQELAREAEDMIDPDRQLTVNVEYYHKDGHTVWTENLVKGLRDEQGTLIGIYGVSRDITERKKAEDALKQDKAFQAMLLDLATKFINVPLAEFDKTIIDMLKKTGEFTGLDRAYLFRHDHQHRVTSNTHEWCREGIIPEIDNLQDIPFDAFAVWWEAWEKGEIVHIPCVAQMPKELATRAILEQQGIQSLAVVPIVVDLVITGFVGFDAVNVCKSFSEQEITLLRVLAEIISNAFARKNAELELGALKAFNENIVQNISEGIIISDLSGNVIFANPTLLDMLGYNAEEFIGSHWTTVVPAEYQHLVEEADTRRLKGIADRYELIFRQKNGALLTFQVSGSPYHDYTTGELAGNIAVLTDISERKKAEELLKASEERIRLMTRNIKDVIVETDTNGYYTYVSDSGPNVLGYGQELIGQRTFDYIHPDDVEKVLLSFSQISDRNKIARLEYRFRHPKRGYIWVEGTGGTYHNSDNETMVLVTIRDVAERKKAEDALHYLSLHDQLTGLFNRRFFEGELRRFAGAREYPVAIVSADFDGLKLINDTLGHSAGDGYLIAGAGVLKTALRSSDILARVGGDEFALLLPRTTQEDGEKLVARIHHSIDSYNQTTEGLPLSISIGLAVCENSNSSLEETFRRADSAMYQDKFERSKNARTAIIRYLMDSLSEHDKAAKRVTDQVQELSVKLGQALNLNNSLLSKIEQLARVRDLGNITLSGQLLQKTSNLTEKESELIRQHAEIGYRIFSSSPDPVLAGLADLVLKHHENFDGTGYPLGLKGEDIPLECRIIAVCAAYCAMTNPRPYAETLTPAEAMKELKRCTGTQCDPQVVEVFENIMKNETP